MTRFDRLNSKILNKIWNWHEIADSDISEASEENNLKIYEKDTFENVVFDNHL